MNLDHEALQAISEAEPSYAYAEVGVIGGLVLENDRWDSVVQLLAADDFFFPAHRIIYQAIAELSEKNCPFDLITLTDRLTQRGQIDSAGGFAYVAEALISHLERIQGSNGITGTPTGFRQLDEKTCGLQAGDLILLAARPSMGKTALGLAFCLGALRHRDDAVVQIFSLEMPTAQLMLRLSAMEGGVALTALRSGLLDDEQWGRISQSLDQFAQWDKRLIIDDCSHQTPALLRARARRYTRQYGKPALIMVDYLQLMCAPGQENRTQEIADISRSLKALGKELECPVLALSQLNRQVEGRADKRPNNGDLRDSGSLEQDADIIFHLYRDEVYHPETLDAGIAEIIIGKYRQGPTGTVRVRFDGRYTRFSDIDSAGGK